MHNPKSNSLPFHLRILQSHNKHHKSLHTLLNTDTQIFQQILDQLKQYQPYSAPFLLKVSKKEAPNYYDIIKNPMDLGTITRNIKKYLNNPENFKKDLDLIWDNCFYYNGPNSVYTEYALKMKEKANSLFNEYFLNKNSPKEIVCENIKCDETNYFMESIMKQKEDLIIEEYNLDDIKFEFQEYFHGTCYFTMRKRLEIDVELNALCTKKMIEQIIVVMLNNMGYGKVHTSAIKIFGSVVYYYLLNIVKKSEGKITEEMLNLKMKDLKIFNIETYEDIIQKEFIFEIDKENDSENNIDDQLEIKNLENVDDDSEIKNDIEV